MFRNLKLSLKLLLTPAMVIVLLLLSGGLSIWAMRVQQSTLVEMQSVRLANSAKIEKMVTDIDSVHRKLYRLIIWCSTGADPKKIEAESKEVKVLLNGTLATMKLMGSESSFDAQEKKFATQLHGILTGYAQEVNNTLDMVGPDINAVMLFVQNADDIFISMEKKVVEFKSYEKELTAKNTNRALGAGQKVTLFLAVAMLFSVAAAIVMSLFINRIIMAPIRSTVQIIESMAAGDLTRRIDVGTADEIGNMARHMNQFIDSLHGTVRSLAANAQELSTASRELSLNSEQMAQGAEQVAVQSAAVATAGEQMTATSRDIASNCQAAAQTSSAAISVAKNGSDVVSNTITVMGKITERVQATAKSIEGLGARSDQIGAIISTIEDIADQTNLLALNAAIEAARAGDQGRGFAVVADEVRALAERTTSATREIGEMIKSIQTETRSAVGEMEAGVHDVRRGTDEASLSGAAIQEILEQIEAVNSQIRQIATAAEEQTATTSEIAGNMQQITGIFDETSRGAQQSSSSAHRLSTLASGLQTAVSRFKIG